MIILPSNYTETLPCINETGATAIIFASPDYKQAYKIYRNVFDYDEEKFNAFLGLNNPNCLSPKDVVCTEDSDRYIGYMMDFDTGKSLPRITNVELSKLINASLDIDTVLSDLSQHHFLIADPNVDNIIFSDTYKFVDAYSFLYLRKFQPQKLYMRNLSKTNETVLCGLINLSYRSYAIAF